MAQDSHLTRYRPAVLAATGFAAAYGVYLIYNATTTQLDNSALHRSNAVYRPRRDRSELQLETRQSSGLPLSDIRLQYGRRVFRFNLLIRDLPSLQEVRDHLGAINEDEYGSIQDLAVALVIRAFSDTSEPDREHLPIRYQGISEALQTGTEEGIRSAGPLLYASLPQVDRRLIDKAIEKAVSDLNVIGDEPDTDIDRTDLAETEDFEAANGARQEPSQGIKGLLYYIAEQDAKRKGYQHRGIACEECGETPIRGVRWHCLNCPDFDLCSTCEAQSVHPKTHVFAKIVIPLPVLSQPSMEHPIWYPGDPRKLHSTLDAGVKKRMSQEYGFDEPGIDALYDQFTCTANVPWNADPIGVHAAIDRRAFNKAFTSERWPLRFSPNALYDRMFAFYDQDGNGLVGFEEFVSGMSYLRGPKRFASLRRALEGFDLDGDGLLNREDFLRLFRAKYVVHRQLVAEMVESREAENTVAAMDILRSSQPISSIFSQEEIPPGENRQPRGKRMDDFGDMRPMLETKTILDDDDPWPRDSSQGPRARNIRGAASADRLRHHLSRFEEQLSSPLDEAHPSSLFVPANSGHGVTQVPQANMNGGHEARSAHEDSQSGTDDDLDLAFDSDVLWQVVEDGFNELLDRMFKSAEDEHNEAKRTSSERQTWRAAIDQAMEEKRAFQEEMQSAALVDPLMATAMNSHPAMKVEKKQNAAEQTGSPRPPFGGEMVATDATSLTCREQEIADRPLEELLASIGYSTVENEEDADASVPPASQDLVGNAMPQDSMPLAQATVTETNDPAIGFDEASVDPMLPQNRPNSESIQHGETNAPDGPYLVDSQIADGAHESVPSRQRLERLASLDVAEREVEERGGIGRLTFDEIENMAQADSTREIRGLITSWLEWASF
ncbi:hypothetical protein KC340_g8988 [Hortaea werneckii]|nr:hypothetical protein KC342_g2452 [Hortaea werneckii]KAI7099621.1 hypothetical protein KC339_g8076 [Hortaea werneckii]KAI7244651.1 hypothetical protein KC365_g1208 [Hortaea werneckii]KAI7315447.1 hypothetical protein KC340_g8988 [Hortaea werneckii]KAI7381819.1 hypothetical protein KC328_g12024 [Hortaea werneckii]